MTAQTPSPAGRFDRRAIPAGASEEWWVAPDGHRIRRIDWPTVDGAARGSLLFLPGRADYYEKYLETLDAWRGGGWRVTSTDWRGQGLSGTPACDEFTGRADAFYTWVDDLAAFWREWIETVPPPRVVVGHSMGGHILLRALADRRIEPDAAVLVAPMLGFRVGFLPLAALHLVARLMACLCGRHPPAWKGGEKPVRAMLDRMDLLTHDRDRYEDELWWRRERPELEMYAPSWGWLEGAIASMRYLRRSGLLEGILQPVLVLATRHDRLVDGLAMERAARRLPRGRLVSYGAEARHELLRERDEVRDRVLAEIEDFLDREAPAPG